VTSDLALLGGKPVANAPKPHFTWPPITESSAQAVLRQLKESISIPDRSGIIARLENALCAYTGSKHTVLTSSGTAALHSVYAACGIGPGDEVIVPAYTFFATATPLFQLGAIPVLADCDENGNISPIDAADRISSNTKAIVVTHLWGVPCDIQSFSSLARTQNLVLIEDIAHACGTKINERSVGTFGLASGCSLNGPKPLSGGEGGFALTSDNEVYYRILLHGQYNKRCHNEIPANHPLAQYATTGTGLKLRISPLAAALTLEQLHRFEERMKGREKIARHMMKGLHSLPGLRLPQIQPNHRPSWYALTLQYRSEELTSLPLERFLAALQAEGCHTIDRPKATCPLHLHPLFQNPTPLFPSYKNMHYMKNMSYMPGDFPLAEKTYKNTLKLPVWHREEDLPLANSYLQAFEKVTANHQHLLETSQ